MIKNLEIEKINFDNIKNKYIGVFMNNLKPKEKKRYIWIVI